MHIDVHIFLQSGEERDWIHSVPWMAEEKTRLASVFEIGPIAPNPFPVLPFMPENLKLVILENTSTLLLWVLHTHTTDTESAALMKSSQPSSLFSWGGEMVKRGIIYPAALRGLNQAGFEFWNTSSPLLPGHRLFTLSPFSSQTLQPVNTQVCTMGLLVPVMANSCPAASGSCSWHR